MIIKTLVENTSLFETLSCEHGLSLYIETSNHKILFDTGASALFKENARNMDVRLEDIDLSILSHGHYDHGGGLKEFLALNQTASIYMNEHAFGDYYSEKMDGKKQYIGLNKNLLPNSRFQFVGKEMQIDDELFLFSKVESKQLNPTGNQFLFKEVDGVLALDDFTHEQNLVIIENKNTILVAGCAHKGIVNIVEHFKHKFGFYPTHVIGGFHLYNRSTNANESSEFIESLAKHLKQTGAQYYTCHCTGMESFTRLETLMGNQIQYLSTGRVISI